MLPKSVDPRGAPEKFFVTPTFPPTLAPFIAMPLIPRPLPIIPPPIFSPVAKRSIPLIVKSFAEKIPSAVTPAPSAKRIKLKLFSIKSAIPITILIFFGLDKNCKNLTINLPKNKVTKNCTILMKKFLTGATTLSVTD